jgi:transposase
MISYFIACHDKEVFSELSEEEWRKALEENPKLNDCECKLNFYERSASGWLEPGKENYVDNKVILQQFERLFILLKYKKSFENAQIEVLVDNARTHSAKQYDLMNFNKFDSVKAAPYETIEWTENGELKVIICSYDEINGLKKCKGLFTLAKELKLIPHDSATTDKQYSLLRLREILSLHQAFTDISKLEILGKKFGVNVVYCPKYHCELNPIEGFWCYLKQYVRKHNTQDFRALHKLINEAMHSYKSSNLNFKLWKRFWKTLDAYNSGKTYQEVLQTFFGAKSSANIISHKKVLHFNTLLSET